MNGLYYAVIKWYDEYRDEEIISRAFIPAPSYTEAAKYAESDFSCINTLSLEEIVTPNAYSDVHMVFMPDDMNVIDLVKSENDY